MQENCTQISGKHGTNEGSGTEPDWLYEKQGLEMKWFPYYTLQNKNWIIKMNIFHLSILKLLNHCWVEDGGLMGREENELRKWVDILPWKCLKLGFYFGAKCSLSHCYGSLKNTAL